MASPISSVHVSSSNGIHHSDGSDGGSHLGINAVNNSPQEMSTGCCHGCWHGIQRGLSRAWGWVRSHLCCYRSEPNPEPQPPDQPPSHGGNSRSSGSNSPSMAALGSPNEYHALKNWDGTLEGCNRLITQWQQEMALLHTTQAELQKELEKLESCCWRFCHRKRMRTIEEELYGILETQWQLTKDIQILEQKRTELQAEVRAEQPSRIVFSTLL